MDMFDLDPLDLTRTLTVAELIAHAKGLLEPGEEARNPEYTRALIEVCCEAAGATQDHKPEMAKELGVAEKDIEKVV